MKKGGVKRARVMEELETLFYKKYSIAEKKTGLGIKDRIFETTNCKGLQLVS